MTTAKVDHDRDHADHKPLVHRPKSHVVTPELAERGSRLLADADDAQAEAIRLQAHIEGLEALKEDAWRRCSSLRAEASKLLLGPASTRYWAY